MVRFVFQFDGEMGRRVWSGNFSKCVAVPTYQVPLTGLLVPGECNQGQGSHVVIAIVGNAKLDLRWARVLVRGAKAHVHQTVVENKVNSRSYRIRVNGVGAGKVGQTAPRDLSIFETRCALTFCCPISDGCNWTIDYAFHRWLWALFFVRIRLGFGVRHLFSGQTIFSVNVVLPGTNRENQFLGSGPKGDKVL